MNAPPANPAQDTTLSQPAPQFAVWLGEEGEPPSEPDTAPPYRFVSCTRSAGGRRLDLAKFEIVSEAPLQDAKTPIQFRRAVEVRVPPSDTELKDVAEEDDPPPQPLIVFSGEMGVCAVATSNEERLTAQARLEPWHFGKPVVGWRCKFIETGGTEEEPTTETVYRIVEEDIAFNPEIDGQVLPNRSDWYEEIPRDPAIEYEPDNLPRYFTWVDPESVRTEQAESILGQTAAEWTLAEAVLSLCYLLNADETYIKNPDYAALKEALKDAPALRSFTVRRGLFLPAVLDDILEPHGYSWFVRQSVQETESTEEDEEDPPPPELSRRITIFKRGAGPEKTVTLQATGETRDIRKSNLATHETEYNIAEAANVVSVFGSPLEVEGTWPLVRGWRPEEDDADIETLTKGDENSEFEQKKDIWRKWVLNEAGDYTDTRPEITEAFDLNNIQDALASYPLGRENVPRRRQFFEPLTLDTDGGRRPIKVEYFAPGEVAEEDEEDPPPEEEEPAEPVGVWKDVETINAPFMVLKRECGIYFTGTTPPEELMGLGEEARLRITACLRGDQRITHTAERDEKSPNGNDVRLLVNAEDRFHQRKRIDLGEYRSIFSVEETPDYVEAVDQVDHTEAIQAYAEKLRDQEQAARITSSIKLEGFHPEYEIGDLITKVEGRNIDLNEYASTAAIKRYPQITGIEYTRDATVLNLETFDDVVMS